MDGWLAAKSESN